MDQIRISAKVLGSVALEEFCPRCYWIKLHTKALPFQIFPGIFSSIDSYTKRIVHAHIDGKFFPDWMEKMGKISGYKKVPHFSKFNVVVPDFGILLTGTPDDILVCAAGGHIIPDYKTAKFTENADKLQPMYRVQLNGYAVIAEACGFAPVNDLFIVYFEPMTDEEYAKARCAFAGFDMTFRAHPVKIPIDMGSLNDAMKRTREIYDLQGPPIGRAGCKDCECLNGIMEACAARDGYLRLP